MTAMITRLWVRQQTKLVIRLAPYAQEINGFPVAPQEPLEEVYYALAELTEQVDGEKLSLLLTTTGSVWVDGKETEELTAAQIQELRRSLFTEEYYSGRYAWRVSDGRVRKKTCGWCGI